LEAAARQLQRYVALVDAGVARARARELEPVRRDSAAGLEDVAALPALEIDDAADVRLQLVPVPLDVREELAGADGRGREAEARLVRRPELARIRRARRGRVAGHGPTATGSDRSASTSTRATRSAARPSH